MTVESSNPRIYTDFSGLANLKASAQAESPEATRAAAKEFEAAFIQMMLKSLRDTTQGDGLMDSESSRMYQEMFDKQIAIDISSRGDFGIAKIVEEQLTKTQGSAPTGADASSKMDQGLSGAALQNKLNQTIRRHMGMDPLAIIDLNKSSAPLIPGLGNSASSAQAVVRLSAHQSERAERFKTPADFIQAMRPHAQRAAREIGVNPDLLIAQSALETGWGNKVIKNSDGSNSFNLFGIKANPAWQGNTARVSSLEYREGVAKQEVSDFRSYASFGESFNDYVRFIKSQPRYDSAVKQAADSESYIQHLQQAGYATDPNYANKVMQILQRNDLKTDGQG